MPDGVTLTLDARLAVDHPVDDIWERIRGLLDKTFGDTNITRNSRSPTAAKAGRRPRLPVRKVERALQDCALPVQTALFGGTTDASNCGRPRSLIVGRETSTSPTAKGDPWMSKKLWARSLIPPPDRAVGELHDQNS